MPFHSEFEEINLRFYVRRTTKDEVRRGVVFIAEIVPSQLIAKTARWVYGENYIRRRMRHSLIDEASTRLVEYGWRGPVEWCELKARTEGEPSVPQEGSLQQFIAEHYWGYSMQKDGSTLEYRVEHVPWSVWTAVQSEFGGNPADLYGKGLSQVLRNPPSSAFVADGSRVSVYDGKKLA